VVLACVCNVCVCVLMLVCVYVCVHSFDQAQAHKAHLRQQLMVAA